MIYSHTVLQKPKHLKHFNKVEVNSFKYTWHMNESGGKYLYIL